MACAARWVVIPVGLVLPLLLVAGAVTSAERPAPAGTRTAQHLRAETTRQRNGHIERSTLDVEGPLRLARECVDDLCHGTWFDGRRHFAFGINGALYPEAPADDSTSAPSSSVPSGTAPALTDAPRGDERVVAVDEPLVAPTSPPLRGASPVELPLAAGPLPRVPCRLAGQLATCLIDSGTTPSAMTLSFAERLGREPHGSIEVRGLGEYLTGVVEAGPLDLGSLAFTSLHFAVVPHPRGAEFDVILGSDALADVEVTFLAAQRRVRLTTGEMDPTEPADAAAIPLTFRDGLGSIDAELGTAGALRSLIVDTGDSGTLSIGYDQYREIPDLFTPRGHALAGGIGSETRDTLVGELDRLAIGPARYDQVPIVAVRGQHQGHLGYAFAKRCGRFVLAFGHGRISCRV